MGLSSTPSRPEPHPRGKRVCPTHHVKLGKTSRMCGRCVREWNLRSGFDLDELPSALSRPSRRKASGQESQEAPVGPEGAQDRHGPEPARQDENTVKVMKEPHAGVNVPNLSVFLNS
jgi:hypothetical protein